MGTEVDAPRKNHRDVPPTRPSPCTTYNGERFPLHGPRACVNQHSDGTGVDVDADRYGTR